MTAGKFAELVGVQAPRVSHILSGRNKPGYDLIVKIMENFPNINPDWLLLGEGPMYRGAQTHLEEPFNSHGLNPHSSPANKEATSTAPDRSSWSDPAEQAPLFAASDSNEREITSIQPQSNNLTPEFKETIELHGTNEPTLFDEAPATGQTYNGTSDDRKAPKAEKSTSDSTRIEKVINDRQFESTSGNPRDTGTEPKNLPGNVYDASGTAKLASSSGLNAESLLNNLCNTKVEIERVMIFYSDNTVSVYTLNK